MISIIFSLITAFLIYYIFRVYRNQSTLPKNYNPKLQPKLNINYPDPINCDRFLASKVKDEEYDTIVIGSGLSGLSAASILSRCGQKCLVLEQHTVAGGWTQTFKRKGFEFDTGVHFIGSQMIDMFNWISKKPFQWVKIGYQKEENQQNITNITHFDNKTLEIGQGLENFMKMIETEFPDDKQAVEQYLSEMDEAENYFNMFYMFNIFITYPIIGTYIRSFFLKKYKAKEKISLEDRLNQLKISREVKKIFCSDLAICGVGPQEASYYLHLMMFKVCISEMYYPSNGADDFAIQSIPLIYDNGGKVLVAKKVKQILLDEKQQKVIGVQMNDKDNTIIKSKNVICAGNFICAIERLLPHSFQEDPEYKYMREKTEISFSTLFIFMGFDGTNEELGFTSANESFCSMDLKDTANTIDDLLNANTISFISFHSTKIKGWAEKYPYKSAGVIMVGHDYEIFEKWAGTLPEKRGQDYEALKSRIAQAYISKHLLKAYPHLKNRIAYTEVGTSLTTENLLEAYKGTSCGIKMNIQRNDRRIDKYLNRQSVGGLWFCGQDLMGGGIFVASKILGYWGLTDTLTGRIFFKDFQNLMKHLENENLEKKKQD